MSQDYYHLLGVSETASSEEIEAAFRDRASEVHPDRVPAGNLYLQSVAGEAFKRLSEAKAVLSDTGKRQKYDEELARSRGRSAAKRTAAAAAATSGFTTTPPSGTARKSPPARPGSAVLAVLACGVLVWAVWLGMNLGSRPTTTAPGTVTPTSGSPPAPPRNAQRSSPAARKKTNAPAKAESDAARAEAPSVGSRPTVTLWRASQPPDLSSISSPDRLNMESACSYAKTQSPDEYNGCLARQLAVHGTTPPPSELSGLSASQRQAIESACASTKLVQGLAAYNHCIAQQLEVMKRRAQ